MRIIFCLCLLLVSACTTLVPVPAQNQLLTWEQRLKTLQRLTHWTLQGTVGVRTREHAWSASLHWEQAPKSYVLQLFGPLGVNRIQLTGTENQASLLSPSQPVATARDPETLLQQALGWQLPVRHLKYWVRGMPSPGLPARHVWDSFHHLAQLDQDNWEINYTEYGNIGGIDLPMRMSLHNARLQVRLVIHQWQR